MHADIGLGQLIKGNVERDAIHVAIAPVTAACKLRPGTRVGFDEQGRATDSAAKHIGIVDPFLTCDINEDDRFWMFLFPNTVIGMRHEWFHPAFPITPAGVDSVAESRAWIELFAAKIDQTYNSVMEAAEQYIGGGWDRWTYDNSERYKDHYDEWPEFWKHYERVTGTQVNAEDKDGCPFTCSC